MGEYIYGGFIDTEGSKAEESLRLSKNKSIKFVDEDPEPCEGCKSLNESEYTVTFSDFNEMIQTKSRRAKIAMSIGILINAILSIISGYYAY
jgi:hypothetical protein